MKKRFVGSIKKKNDRGFRFIASETSGGKDLFFHSKSLDDPFDELREGDIVGFEIEEAASRVNAVAVRREGSDHAASRRRRAEIFDEALRDWKSFRQAGLVDPEGVPLSKDSDEGRQIIIDVSAVNEELLARLHDHPELMRELPSRRFEEVVAELLLLSP
jgi:cold shock CspA family protein